MCVGEGDPIYDQISSFQKTTLLIITILWQILFASLNEDNINFSWG